ncbi:MAG: sirohydrochlorin chelatase [Halobacteriales archaeon]
MTTDDQPGDSEGTRAVLLAGHGSRREASNQHVRDVADRLSDQLDERVKPAFIELEPPSLGEGVDDLADHADHVTVVPLMLFAAGHVKNDVPLVLDQARERHPDLTVDYGSHLGVRPELVDLIADRVETAAADLSVDPETDDVAVAFCARGSSDPDANADAVKLARLLYEGRSFTRVEPAFIGVTGPHVEDALEDLALREPDAVIVVPYMLGDGVLNQRVQGWVDDFDAEHPDIETATADVIGLDDRLIDVLADRVREARAGEVTMSCDTCKYKVTLADFEDEVGGEKALREALAHQAAHAEERGEEGHDHEHDHSHSHDHGHDHDH